MSLVMLHGFLGSSRDWLPLARAFADCSTPDLPGHGDAVNLPDAAYTMHGAAARVAERMPDDSILYGYSMGGRLALHMVCSGIVLPRALVLESATAGLEDGRPERLAADEAWAVRFETEPLEQVLQNWYQQPVFASLGSGEAFSDMVASRLSGDGREWARSLRGMSVGRQPSHWDALQSLNIPVLFIAGASDTRYCTTLQRMADLCPSAEMRIVPRAGHNVHAAQPAAVREALTTFLETL